MKNYSTDGKTLTIDQIPMDDTKVYVRRVMNSYAAQDALCQGAVYGFWNLDHVDYFKATEFVPLYDEETGALMAGIRFWQISENKPLRATLYEEHGRKLKLTQ